MDKHLQESMLCELKEGRIKTLLFLRNGVQMRGFVEDYDDLAILLECPDCKKLVYLGVLSTIQPLGNEE